MYLLSSHTHELCRPSPNISTNHRSGHLRRANAKNDEEKGEDARRMSEWEDAAKVKRPLERLGGGKRPRVTVSRPEALLLTHARHRDA